MSDLDAAHAISALIKEIEAETLKDMGRTMAALKQRFAGQMDFSKASAHGEEAAGRLADAAAAARVTGFMTKRRILLGLIGRNIQGSLSPALFADAFEAAGIDGYYHLIDLDRMPGRRLPQLLDAIKAAGFAGANITYPFKQDIIPLLDAVDPEAAQVGAVNTVAIALDGCTTGYNFDRRGWRNSFAENLGGDSAQGATVVQVGAGGAGRAVAFALMDLGVAALIIHDIDERARRSPEGGCRQALRRGALPRVSGDLARDIAAADGVVNATQMGMTGFPGNPVPMSQVKPKNWAADVIYTPVETEFLKAAVDKGARVLNGSGMCVHQAVEAFRLLTGDIARCCAHASRLCQGSCRARRGNGLSRDRMIVPIAANR